MVEEIKIPCEKCGGEMIAKTRTSICESWTDTKWICISCGYFYWVDGIDS